MVLRIIRAFSQLCEGVISMKRMLGIADRTYARTAVTSTAKKANRWKNFILTRRTARRVK